MTQEEKAIMDIEKENALLKHRVWLLEKVVYWFIGFVALNLLASFFLWLQSIKK